jgi:foldase protein PrsA
MQSMIDGYYQTDDQVTAAREFMAKSTALQTKLEDQIVETIDPSDATLKKYMNDNIDDYDESTVSAYHILVSTETAAKALEDEAGGTAEGFMAVYEEYQGNSTITEEADLGAFHKSDMVEEFSDVAFSMEPGDVVGCVETEYGYHLIYVYDKNTVELPTFDEIKDQVREDYIASVQDEITSDFLNKVINVSVRRKDYKQMPSDLLIEKLYETYNVKMYLKRALRD